MSDITKCLGHGCELKLSCYRFTAKSHPYRQAYAHFDLKLHDLRLTNKNTQCEYYWGG